MRTCRSVPSDALKQASRGSLLQHGERRIANIPSRYTHPPFLEGHLLMNAFHISTTISIASGEMTLPSSAASSLGEVKLYEMGPAPSAVLPPHRLAAA
jgi:hypothetical protein